MEIDTHVVEGINNSSCSEHHNIMAAFQKGKDHVKNTFVYCVEGFRNVFKADDVGLEIAHIALPALIALGAEPLASLVDTICIGRLGSIELAAVGVSVAVFNLVSKLLNIPVLNLTASFVAEEASGPTIDNHELESCADSLYADDQRLMAPAKDADLYMPKMVDEKRVLPAVSTALLVGALLGLLEFIILAAGSEQILTIMGIPRGSSMEEPAEHFLQLRAVGAPAVVISLTTQGVFRGFKDTKTPLYATAIGNVLNMILVPFFIFFLDYGVTGAAAGNVISQYLTALILLFKMSRNISLIPPKLQDLNFLGFVKYGGLLLIRSTATMLTMTLATSEAARQGVVPMAAHQICMQVWLAASLLSDAIALASQAIIASALARGLYDVAKDAAFRSLKIGCCFGLLISLLLLGFSMVGLSKIFTNDLQVLAFVSLGLPFVIATQPINSLAFVFDGIHFGALDFWYAAKSMVLVAILASMTIFLAARVMGFVGIWIGLSSFMALRMLVGFFRIGTASGPWKFLR